MALVARLLTAAAVFDEAIGELAREYGVDRGQGDVLFTLRRAGRPYRLSPSALARATLVTSGTMTNRLDRLEQLGLVERVPHPVDRRGMDVQLTRRGVRLAEEAVTRHVAREEELLAPLSARDRAQLDRLLRKLTRTR